MSPRYWLSQSILVFRRDAAMYGRVALLRKIFSISSGFQDDVTDDSELLGLAAPIDERIGSLSMYVGWIVESTLTLN